MSRIGSADRRILAEALFGVIELVEKQRRGGGSVLDPPPGLFSSCRRALFEISNFHDALVQSRIDVSLERLLG